MSHFAPITLRAIDSDNKLLFEYVVAFRMGISARQVLEEAFVLAQTSTAPDPFIFTLEFFGYSEAAQFPGFLGYEIESIGTFANNEQFFWDLLIDGVPSTSGADTTYPNPGSTVLWQYTPVSNVQAVVNKRAVIIQSRRSARS